MSVRIGFRLHTGWAMLVAVDAEPLRVVHRCRIELLPAGMGRFAYHQAAELAVTDAEKLIESCRKSADATARTAIRGAIKDLKVTGGCIPTGSAAAPGDLSVILRSHARIHAAEGALYARAIASACDHLKISVIMVRERDVWIRAASNAGTTEAELRARIDAVRQTLGPPWTADHKIATAAALVRSIL